MLIDLTQLTQRVTDIESVGDSAVALVSGLSARLKEALASPDPAAVQALSDRLEAQKNELAEAVAMNTVAEDEPPASVDPTPVTPDYPT